VKARSRVFNAVSAAKGLCVPMVVGMQTITDAGCWLTTRMEPMGAESTTKSLPMAKTGTLPQLSEQGAVAPCSTKIERMFLNDGLDPTPETIAIMAAMLVGLMREQLSGDSMVLAMYDAKDICRDLGIPEESFKKVQKTVLDKWMQMRKKNPMSCLF